MEDLSWEEKYLRLRDHHTSLTHKANEQDDTIRRYDMFTNRVSSAKKIQNGIFATDGIPHAHGTSTEYHITGYFCLLVHRGILS